MLKGSLRYLHLEITFPWILLNMILKDVPDKSCRCLLVICKFSYMIRCFLGKWMKVVVSCMYNNVHIWQLQTKSNACYSSKCGARIFQRQKIHINREMNAACPLCINFVHFLQIMFTNNFMLWRNQNCVGLNINELVLAKFIFMV